MNHSAYVRKCIWLAVSTAVIMLTAVSMSWADSGSTVRWQKIIGKNLTPGTVVGGVQPVGFPWTTLDGEASVQLATGRIRFSVRGLVLSSSTNLAVVGTIGVRRKVKGTLVCNGESDEVSALVDTPAVPLDPQGNASFAGEVAIPNDCLVTPDKLAFLIRVAEAPGNPSLVNLWNAAGVVRTP